MGKPFQCQCVLGDFFIVELHLFILECLKQCQQLFIVGLQQQLSAEYRRYFVIVKSYVLNSVNALGNIYDPMTGAPVREVPQKEGAATFSNTTISCILTNALLTKAEANKLADVTQDAYAKCIRPVHTLYDGDTIFTLASGRVKADLLTLQMLADSLTCEAILRAVRSRDD